MSKEDFTFKEWADSNVIVADRKAIFEDTIEPLANQLQALCKEVGMPAVLFFAVAHDVDGEDSHVIQSLPTDPSLLGPATMKVLCAANQVAIPLEKIDLIAALRSMRSECKPH